MRLEAATASDLPALTALEEHFDAAERWSTALWRDELTAPDRHVTLVRDDGGVVGAATFQCVVDVADLHRVVVAPTHRRRGVARQLVADGVEWARAHGARRMLLEVRHDNAPAIALYDAHGFRRLAQRTDYYAPGAHAVVMELTLAPERTAA